MGQKLVLKVETELDECVFTMYEYKTKALSLKRLNDSTVGKIYSFNG